jgi:hypothetical protein
LIDLVGRHYARIIIGCGTGNDPIDVVRSLRREQNILDEVGAGPSVGCSAVIKAHTPWDIFVSDHLVDQGLQVGKGCRDGVTESLELGGAVPDDRLDIGLSRNGEPFAVDRAHRDPVGSVIGLGTADGVQGQQHARVELERGEVRPEEHVRRCALDHGIQDGGVAGGLAIDLDTAGIL